MNKLNNFGPVYLINLKDQTHRLENAKKEFKKYGIKDYTVIEAVDGRNNDLSDIIIGKYPRLKPSEIGCITSHIKALKHWLDTSNSEYAIIMEDDFSFDTVQHWSFDWDYVINNVPANYEIVQLVMIKNEPIKFNMHKKIKFNIEDKMIYEWSTACYLIKRNYAKLLVDSHYKDEKYILKNHGFKNQAADVILYNMGNAYSMPIFTHILDPDNSINKDHNEFHTKSKTNIDSWWANNSKDYTKEQLFNPNIELQIKTKKENICFKIFHIDSDAPIMQTRNILTQRAIKKLKENFDDFETPTIIIKNLTDVKDFYSNELIKIDPKGFEKKGWKPGELGIWASNYIAWKNFEKSDYDSIILMEDDIVLDKNFNNKLIDYMNELPDDWDIFTVYIPEKGNVRYNKANKKLFVGKENICRVYQSWSCLCYIVSKRGAKKLLEQVKNPISSPIDHYLFYHNDLNVYAIKYERRNICEIYSTESTVQSAEKHDMTGYV